jgi:hypothetical protein
MVLLCVQTEKLVYRSHRIDDHAVPQRPVTRDLTAEPRMVRVPAVYMVADVAGAACSTITPRPCSRAAG